MSRGLRFPKWAGRPRRRTVKPRQGALGASPYDRRLAVEPLEPRTLLSSGPGSIIDAQVRSGDLQVSAGSDTWDMSLVGLGYGGAVQPVGTAETSANGDRVDCDYGAIDEWYLNGPGGLEQGFTVNLAPPQQGATGSASAALTVELALGGDLRGTVNAAGDGLTLCRPDGSAALSYTGLVARDATGKALPASLEVRAEGGRQDLLIHVNTAGAQGPITVDPVVQQAELTASDGGYGDRFGGSVSVGGNTLVVVAPLAPFNAYSGTAGPGEAYVFTESGSGWTQEADFTLPGGVGPVSINEAGNTLVVGSGGAACVFTGSGSSWTQVATLTPSDGASAFGDSVSISGNTVVVGAWYPTVGGDGEQGTAYVFCEPDSGWAGEPNETQTAELTASDGAVGDEFGYSLSISGDTVVVGAPGATVGGNSSEGRAYVFAEPSSGWASEPSETQTAELTDPEELEMPGDTGAGDCFGYAVAISGNTLVAGAPYATLNNSAGRIDQGIAYVFTESGSTWGDAGGLLAYDRGGNDYLGSSVSISGNTVAVGAPNATVAGSPSFVDQGKVYVFSPLSGSDWSSCNLEELVASDSESTYAYSFGSSVATDGSTVVAGAPRNGAVSFQQGAAYVFGQGQAPTPAVTGVNPSAGPTLGELVTITGTGFDGATAVDFGTTASSTFNVISEFEITAISPPESAGPVDVTVIGPGGTSATSAADQFTYFAAPTGLSASATGTQSITIEWNSVSGATHYLLDRSTSAGGPWTQINDASGKQYTDSGSPLQPGATYYYEVCAANNSGDSAFASPVFATTWTAAATWSGGGADTNWSDAANWGGVAAAANDSLSFSQFAGLSNTNDLAAGTQFDGMAFSAGAGAFVLGGNAVSLAGDITNNSTNTQTINLPLVLTGASRALNAASGTLTVAGPISENGGSFGVTINGAETLTLSGANTYTGGTAVDNGLLAVENSAAIPSGSSLSIGPGGSLVLGNPGTTEGPMMARAAPGGALQAAPAAVAPAVVDRLLATQPVLASGEAASAVAGRTSSRRPSGHSPAAPASHSSSFIFSPSSLVLPTAPVPHSDAAAADHAGGRPAGDAAPRVAALRTAASGQASDQVLLRIAEARPRNAASQAGNQHPATRLYGLTLQTLDLLAGAAVKRR
ncbi:MAG: IPT/TIG domain-containing protein [Thermoguttaceae bacterium]|jgi:autotransporter-associated beta strand protein